VTSAEPLPRILLVEDNRADARFALHALRAAGLGGVAHLARDGIEALEYLLAEGSEMRLGAIRVVFLDIKLPKLDGIEVLRRIRSDPRTATLPVVMFTSSGESRDRWACRALGVNGYVVKPVAFAELSTTVVRMAEDWLESDGPGARPPDPRDH